MMLMENNSQLKQKRATMLANQLQNAMDQKRLQLKNELDKIDLEIDKLMDIGPKSSVDLTVGNDVNAIDWINKLHDLKTKRLMLTETDIKINEEMMDEYFHDEEKRITKQS